MIKKIFISILLSFFILLNSSFADDQVGDIAIKWFNSYSKKISIKYNDDKEILFFEGFNDKLNDLLAKKKFNQAQTNLINDLIKLSNEYIFNIEFKNSEKNSKAKLKSINLLNDFKYFSYNPDHIFLENGVWYTYKFDKHLKFTEGTEITTQDLKYNNISTDKSIVFLKPDNNLGFIVEYEKVKLVSDSIIYGISNKYDFLKEIKDDKKILNQDTDGLFIKLKDESTKLSAGKVKSIKIKSIYDYILNNVEYPTTFSLDDAKIFSGIDTFKNKSGVCEGYTKMFMYMLNFSHINNTEVVRGYVIDAQDFPKVGHAWIKIGDDYYDPTFDDPIGNTKTKTQEEYNFFALPKDLFYTNRYDYNVLPEYLKEKDLIFRKTLINQNIIPLLPKYKTSGYNLLKPYLLKLKNGIDLNKKIDLEDLKKIMGYYEVENLKFIKNGGKVSITGYNYYVIDDKSVEDLLTQIDYNYQNFYLFKWKLENGTFEYRFAYDVKLK